jgi:hypothetical protein
MGLRLRAWAVAQGLGRGDGSVPEESGCGFKLEPASETDRRAFARVAFNSNEWHRFLLLTRNLEPEVTVAALS